MTKGFKFIWYGKKLLKKIEAKTEKALDRIAILTQKAASDSMSEPKSGKPVPPGQGSRGGHPWQKRQRSAPGEAPAVQIGQLQGSITHVKPAPLVRHVGTNVKHGLRLEVGTSNMLARPWLRPAFNRHKDVLGKYMKDAI